MTGHAFALAMAALDEANGPEDRPPGQDAPAEWDTIDWRAHEGQVRRLRQRIFKASQEQGWAKDRRDRRGGRADSRGQGGGGGAGAPVHLVMESPRGQARVHTESIKPCETSPARYSGHNGSLSSSQG